MDVAIVWGALAGYFASRMQTDLTIVPVSPQFALTPDGHWLYASNDNAGLATATDLRTDEVAATLVVGIEPEGVAVSPDGRWVYVTAETSSTISVIDTRSNTVVANFFVGHTRVRPFSHRTERERMLPLKSVGRCQWLTSRRGLHATGDFIIDRREWGITYSGKPDDLIDDEVRIMFEVVAARDVVSPSATPALNVQ